MEEKFSQFALPTPSEMAKIDQEASKTIPVKQLMENAGWFVARTILRLYKPCKTIVLCGPGNNGGDGYVTARLLAKEGWPVSIAALASPKKGSDAAWAASQWEGPYVDFSVESVSNASLVIDAVFGAGLSKPIADKIAKVLQAANRIVAIDMPSGIDGRTGEIRGYAPKVEHTITFFRLKPGHLLFPGREYCGKTILGDIGIPDKTLQSVQGNHWQNEPGLWEIPSSDIHDYKYHRGIVSICGSSEMTGAARLAALGARMTGAGLVKIFAPENPDIYRVGDPGLVIESQKLEKLLEDERCKVWICGPGLLPKEVKKILPILIKEGKTVLADAGAFQKNGIKALKGAAVITPHIGEFKRVFGSIASTRLDAVKEAASKLGSVVVLKGPDTLIASPTGQVAINHHASSALATAGSGDVLSGIIGALLATKMPPWEAACAGVWLHGEAGRLSNPWPIAENIVKYLGQARENAKYFKISEKYGCSIV